MRIAEIRRENLRALADSHGSKNLSKLLGYRQPAFLSQMIGPNPSRAVSEKSARQYEEALGLESGFLDIPLMTNGGSTPASQLQKIITLATETVQMVGSLLQKESLALSPTQFAKLVNIEMINAAERNLKPREAYIKSMLDLIQ